MADLWKPKNEWSRRGRNFSVVVSRHQEEIRPERDEGPHRWCVYAFVYPKHPHFAAFDGWRMFQDAATALPLHGGPSLLTPHFNGAQEVQSIQVGADYHHLHDDHFTYCETKEEAATVFADAEELFAWLNVRDQAPPRLAREEVAP